LATSATVAARGDRHRRAEAGQGLHQRPEAEGDQHRLDALIVADLGERAPQHVEVAGGHRHVVDPDRIDHDPHDREQAVGRAVQRGVERIADRHRVDNGRDDDGYQ
jgi:hypothetical protein